MPCHRWQSKRSVLPVMPASSNFQEAIREAQSSALVGPTVVNKALPYVGGGLGLTSSGVIGGLSMMATPLFMPLFWVAVIGNLVLFFVAQNVAMKGNNATALPLLSIYSLITGFTLSGLVAFAGAAAGIGAVGTAALATGITFVIASIVGRRMSDSVGQALSGVVGLGLIGLILAMVVQFIGGPRRRVPRHQRELMMPLRHRAVRGPLSSTPTRCRAPRDD